MVFGIFILMMKFSYSKKRLFGEWDISKIKKMHSIFQKYMSSFAL